MKASLKTLFRLAGLPEPAAERTFAPGRLWRFDYCWPDRLLAVEYEGGAGAGGRHTRYHGYDGDCEKYSHAALLGWCVLRFTRQMVNDGRALVLLEKAAQLTAAKEVC